MWDTSWKDNGQFQIGERRTLTMDMQLAKEIANTLALVGNILMKGDIECGEEVKKDVILIIDNMLEGFRVTYMDRLLGPKYMASTARAKARLDKQLSIDCPTYSSPLEGARTHN